jgi:hypothetical protein
MACFARWAQGRLHGLLGVYVDDTLCAVYSHYEELSKTTAEKFKFGTLSHVPLTFGSSDISETDEGYQKTQDNYRGKLRSLLLSASFADFRSPRVQLTWMVHCQHDVRVDVSMEAQVTKESFRVSDVWALNLAINRVMNKNLTLTYTSLEKVSLRLVAFAVASFANNSDLISQPQVAACYQASTRCSILMMCSAWLARCKRVGKVD